MLRTKISGSVIRQANARNGDPQRIREQIDLDGDRPHGPGQVVQPPGEEAAADRREGKKDSGAQVIPRGGFERGVSRDEIQGDKERGGYHENDGEMNHHGMNMPAEKGIARQEAR